MAPRKKKIEENKQSCECHTFKTDDEEIVTVRKNLLNWFADNSRTLPWRSIAKDEVDLNVRGYSVWVSEIMLQQTQVSTVIDYYNRWMKKWPNVSSLSKATLEEVNQMWSGLGYYSRGKRLWEGAKKVVEQFGGEMPRTSESLLKELPGVGRYTAAAIASIAFGEPVGLVDGNVIRVIARMRKIGADSNRDDVSESIWTSAGRLVDPNQPGDFNQSLMELGATVCTPKNPSCSKCPVAESCRAFGQVKRFDEENKNKFFNRRESQHSQDIEDCCTKDCFLCLPPSAYAKSDGVMNFPRKAKKAAARQELSIVVIVSRSVAGQKQFCLLQRPSTGLLANLLEFPSFKMTGNDNSKESETITKKVVGNLLKENFSIEATELKDLGEIVHQFSHIRQTYRVWSGTTSSAKVKFQSDLFQKCDWLTESEIRTSAISTAMRKVFALISNDRTGTQEDQNRGIKRELETDNESPKAKKKINDFFKRK